VLFRPHARVREHPNRLRQRGHCASRLLLLARRCAATVQHITDAGDRADDVEIVFPFTAGVTGILFDASTYQFAGYVKSGAQTLLLQQANVSGPGVLP
jgi:hypothetical protein